MDLLDRLAAPATDLLTRVDAALVRSGAPDDHPMWSLLRRVRALPGEAVAAFVAVSPAALADTGVVLRGLCARYAQAEAMLPIELAWRGAGADSFVPQWRALRGHLGSDLTDRLRATVSYVDAVGDWTRETRHALARTLVVVLASAEAVSVRTSVSAGDGDWPAAAAVPQDAARAAADIAARVLETLAEAYDRGEALLGEWVGRLGEAHYHPPVAVASTAAETTTEVVFSGAEGGGVPRPPARQ